MKATAQGVVAVATALAGPAAWAAGGQADIAHEASSTLALTLLDVHHQATAIAVGLAAFAFLAIGCSLLMGQIPARWFWSVFGGLVSLSVVNQVAGYIIGTTAADASTGVVEQIEDAALGSGATPWGGGTFAPRIAGPGGGTPSRRPGDAPPEQREEAANAIAGWRMVQAAPARGTRAERATDLAAGRQAMTRYCRHARAYACRWSKDANGVIQLAVRSRPAQDAPTAGPDGAGRPIETIRFPHIDGSSLEFLNPGQQA